MAPWKTITLGALGTLTVAGGIAYGVAQSRWNQETEAAVDELRAANPPGTRFVNYADLAGLPQPVARYLRWSLPEGTQITTFAHLRQTGRFLMDVKNENWAPFTSEQTFGYLEPSFVWDAHIHAGPGMDVRVRDEFRHGHGSIHAAMFGMMTVADNRGKPELDAGALQRYLGELVWNPAALLPGGHVQWQAIDDYSALAAIRVGETLVEMEFHFKETGELSHVYTEARYAEDNGAFVKRPWRVRVFDWETWHGVKIPRYAIVSWVYPDGEKEAIKMTVDQVDWR